MSSYTEADVLELERLVALVSPDRPNVKQLLESQITIVKAKVPKVNTIHPATRHSIGNKAIFKLFYSLLKK
jgi:hypothetical protein